MANVIEVALKLQDTMSAGLQKAAGNVKSFATILQAPMATLGGFAGIALAAGAAASTMAVKLAEQVEQLDNLATSSGISAQRLQVLQFAFKQGGVDSGALTQGLNFMTRAIENNQEKLLALGVTSRDSFTAFMQLADVLANTQDVAKRNALAFQVFGRGAGQIIPIMEKLATNFDSVSVAAEKSGNVLSDFDLEKLRELDTQFDQLQASVEGFGKRIAVVVAGPLVDLINGLSKLPEALGKTKTLLDRLLSNPRSMFPNGALPQALDPRKNAGRGGPMVPKFMPDMGTFNTWTQGDNLGLRQPIAQRLGIDNLVPEVTLKLDEAGKKFMEFSQKVEESFRVIGDSVYSGFYSVLNNLMSRTQTLSSAMKTIWQSIVSGVLDAMARLLSSAITSAFIKLLGFALSAVTGMPVFAMAGSALSSTGGPIEFDNSRTGGTQFGGSPTSGVAVGPGAQPMGMQGGNTFIIQTINAKDTLQSLISPTGTMRSANSRMIEVAAVS